MLSLRKREERPAAHKTLYLLKGILLFSILSLLLTNYTILNNLDFVYGSSGYTVITTTDAATNAPHNPKSVTAYWWPSAEDGGGLIGKIHAIQNPDDCASSTTKFLVWQSMKNNEKDTRGLTAWGHAGSTHLLHALSDGDQLEVSGSRILIADDQLWPMAKGCTHGPETRECYFEPLTKCKLSDVDPPTSSSSGGNSVVLNKNSDEYDRTVRTVYTSPNDIWFRITKRKYSWTGLPGTETDHSSIDITAAALAYYFRPREWLQKEIDGRIRASIPADLDPMRTVGVPIRRSDKCHGHTLKGSAAGELDCPPLEKYLDGVRSFLDFDPLIQNVIVTSEDSKACDEFLGMVGRELPGLRVVRNVGDVQQGTGSGSKLEAYVENSANANVVASALTSMHLHLRARYFVITSKSTWTSTIPG
mmetsp:Transcript_32001/g.69130  ORF Transcript_32001/g.69130 Transcript_32001/m.69130 type:complete len:418 (+) Transcript_32001:160-1413(+)